MGRWVWTYGYKVKVGGRSAAICCNHAPLPSVVSFTTETANAMFESPVLPFIAFFAMAFGIVYISVTARHRQRMAMIEKGLDPRTSDHERTGGRRLALKFGLLMMGIGVGVLLGYGLSWVMPPRPSPYDQDPDNPVPYFFSVLFCGGLALVLDHFLVHRRKDRA